MNFYDLLDVDESAGADQIRAAWKSAIADLDPTERRFRAFNDAAAVLLDPDRRAAYDAELAEARDVEEPDEPAPSERPVDSAPLPAAAATESVAESAAEPAAEAAPATGARPGPSALALIVAGVAAVLAIGLVVWLTTLDGMKGTSPKAVAEQGVRQDKAVVSAEGAAEQMVAPVLSYNHKTMAADLERLRGFLTPAMAEKQAKAWPELTKEAESQEIVVEASATGVALTRVDDAGERATVVVFIDQRVSKKGTDPFVLHMWATMELVKASGSEDTWKLDDLCTDDSCG